MQTGFWLGNVLDGVTWKTERKMDHRDTNYEDGKNQMRNDRLWYWWN
jgi:hypothetical protein